MSPAQQSRSLLERTGPLILEADGQNWMRITRISDIFPITISRHGRTAQGPGLGQCRSPIHPSTDNISDAAVYLLTFAGYNLEQTEDECVKLYGDGDEVKESSIRNGWSIRMIALRVSHVVDGLRGVDRSDSYGPRIRAVIEIIREEGRAEAEASRIQELVIDVLEEATDSEEES
ncbi:conserved hypothetical protein [Histoplasma capsulatum var. duboisii H88]|uniref:Uncharacterized protein n=2 Tax=Ajellomyces capsulatus TaxID=5037 RepID=F0UPJ6_AJEC8|nr:conserved hypothetical protein [Histoplasma capsulatum H143]EGC47795.1 conserved hypothetical protein [Histoplasma capsulatum var. duboisii H88]